MLTNYTINIIVLGILIFVHELGHFFVAKRSGVTVLRVFFGFWAENIQNHSRRNRILSVVGTSGGYVKMLGEDRGRTAGRSTQPGLFRAESVEAAGDRICRSALKLRYGDSHFYVPICILWNPVNELLTSGPLIPGSPRKGWFESGDRVSFDQWPVDLALGTISPNPLKKLGLKPWISA